jgi:tripartite-type tricarboxylate transporter receptor subunit TctC
MVKRILRLAASAAFAAVLLQSSALQAQDFPSKPVTIVVPYAAGGTGDIVARLIEPELEKALGQSVIIENKPGAGAAVGSEYVAQAPADGYTVLLGLTALTIAPNINKKINYDVEKSFDPVALVATGTMLLLVNDKQPFQTVPDLIAYAKANPGKLGFATSGPNTFPHMMLELFKTTSGIDLIHLPYKGGGPSMAGLVSGEAAVSFDAYTGAKPQLDAGTIRALAVTGPQRWSLLPELPTMIESGVEDFDAIFWIGALVPEGTPRAVVDKLNAAFNAALSNEQVKKEMSSQALDAAPGTPEDFGKLLSREVARWGEVVQKAGLTVEQ